MQTKEISPERAGAATPSTGWRTFDDAVIVSNDTGRRGEEIAVSKGRAMIAVKRVAPALGLKAGDLLLLDTLAAFSPPQDWTEGARAIVWPSNAYLMERTGYSLSSVKRHGRRLLEKGLLRFQDSPNGKRWGKRCPRGHIIEAYGFDLTPLRARVTELEALHAELTAERELCQRLRRQITVLRRDLRASLTYLEKRAEPLWNGFNRLLDSIPRGRAPSHVLERALEQFLTFKSEVSAMQVRAQEPDPLGSKNDPHIQDTTEDNIDEVERETQTTPITPAFVLTACPEFKSWIIEERNRFQDWNELARKADRIPTLVGIKAPAWKRAKQELGTVLATTALALIVEKVSLGKVLHPERYLHGIIRKARKNEMHLDRSLHGLQAANCL